MEKLQLLKEHLTFLRLTVGAEQIEALLHQATKEQPSYLDWLLLFVVTPKIRTRS